MVRSILAAPIFLIGIFFYGAAMACGVVADMVSRNTHLKYTNISGRTFYIKKPQGLGEPSAD